MFIDSHCHLDAAEFDTDRSGIIEQSGLGAMVVPAVEAGNFQTVRALARQHLNVVYALGIHPMYVHHAAESDLASLEAEVVASLDDGQFVAIGEIGLDFFVPEISAGPPREKQEHFFQAQLGLAKKYGLPVILHVRKSQDSLLKYLRRAGVSGGIAHAFNGSEQQAKAFLQLNFCLGFGGAMTYTRALQIRRLAVLLQDTDFVLETDSPDIPPEWLARESDTGRNTPIQVIRIAQCLAALRHVGLEHVEAVSTMNARRVLPRLATWLDRQGVA